jgi:hypothetical protein
MNALVFDSDNFDRAKRFAHVLQDTGLETRIQYQGKFYDSLGSPSIRSSGSYSLVLWHKSNQQEFEKAGVLATAVLSFSAGGAGEIPDALTAKAAAHIFEALSDSLVTDLKERILSFWKQEPVLALRLLCEAKQMCGNAPFKEVNGVTINAPISIEQWLAPFGKRNAGEIDDVVQLMGRKEAREKARGVLQAVRDSGDVDGSISDFLTYSRQSAGD